MILGTSHDEDGGLTVKMRPVQVPPAWMTTQPPPPQLPVEPGRMLRLGIAAVVASALVAAMDAFVYFAQRDWRAELGARIDTPAEREALRVPRDLVATGDYPTRLAEGLLMLAELGMAAMVFWWTALVVRNRAAWYGPSYGLFGATPAPRRTREARRTAITPIPVAVVAAVVES